MRASLACTGAELLARTAGDIVGRLAAAQAERGLAATAAQIGAWEASLARLREAVAANGGAGWTIAFEYDLIRLGKRIDAVVLTDRAISSSSRHATPLLPLSPTPRIMRSTSSTSTRARASM